MTKKVLIIGGSGFIGINLAKFLVENRNCDVTLADFKISRDLNEYFSESFRKKVTIVEDDFTLPIAYEQLEGDFDNVYMLASIVGVNNTLDNPDQVIKINSLLILNCLEWLKSTSVKRVLFSSTSEAYSGTTEAFDYPIPTDENVPLTIKDISDPRYTYAVTKILGESAFLNYAKKSKFEAVIVRYHNAFGPDMGFKHVIPHLVERFKNGENPFKMYGYDQTRSFCYISDTVEGTVLAMESQTASGEIFHIGNSEEITIENLIRTVGEIVGFEGEYVQAPTYPGSVSRRCPDISKSKELLNYRPKVKWQRGLEITVDWYQSFFAVNSSAKQDGFK